MKEFFNNRSIGFKILGGILLVIAIGTSSSLFGLFSIQKIGVGLDTVTRDNMPLLNRMSSINEQQLEQSVLFERGMQLALIISSTEDGYEQVSRLKKSYAERGEAVVAAMNDFVMLAENAARENVGQDRNEFNQMAETMKTMRARFQEMQKPTEKIFSYMLVGRIDDAGPMVARAQKDSTELRSRLVEMHQNLVKKTEAATKAARQQKIAAFAGVSALTMVSILVGLVLAGLITRGITSPLKKTLTALEDIAEGEGDLTQRIQVQGKDELAQLGHAFNHFADKIHNVLISVTEAAECIVEGSRGINNSNTTLLARTDEQRTRLSESSSSMEEMTETVKQNAEGAHEAKQLAETNRERAMAGADVVMRAVDAVSEINQSSDQIADIIGTIDGIAFQTNLLALNAAVEAARAGEQGRGFAVVASEVRSLAQRSAEAAKEIKTLIQNSLEKVRTGTRLVDESGMALEEIIVGTKRVAELISDIADLSKEQASGIDIVNTSITHMDKMTDDNAIMVRETAAASNTMLDQAESLMRQIGFFKLDDGNNILARPEDSEKPYLQ